MKNLFASTPAGVCSGRRLLICGIALLTAFGWPATGASAEVETRPGSDDFGRLVQLAPFVVSGQQLSISVHARTKRDRRYAEGFAEEVIKVVYEAVTQETGKGLVIIGRKGEPHPIVVFRKFQELAKAGKLDPAIAAREPELFAMLDHWRHAVDRDDDGKSAHEAKSAEGGKRATPDREPGEDLEFEKIVTALPLPLEGIGAKLYQLAWTENFDEAKVAARLVALRAGDLERRDLFAHFDWVFYLPPKGAFDQVLDDLIAEALKEEDAGFFARTAVKGVMLVVKPKIRQAIEALRHGVMLMTVLQARTTHREADISAITGAYIEALMPGGKSGSGSPHERAVKAVRDQIKLNAEKVKTVPAVAS